MKILKVSGRTKLFCPNCISFKKCIKKIIILTLNFSIALSKNRQQYVFNRLVIQVCTSSEEAQNGVILSYVQILSILGFF